MERDTLIYKIMDEYAGQIAYDIVRELPEYDMAEWG